MNAKEVRRVIQKVDQGRGTFFSAINVKRDGTTRRWVCRLGVRKHLHGGPEAYNAESRNLLTVWDPNASGRDKYRNINISTLSFLKVRGIVLVKNGKPTRNFTLYE